MTLQTAVPVPGFAGTEEGYTPLQSTIARTGVRKGARRLGWRVVRGSMDHNAAHAGREGASVLGFGGTRPGWY